MHDYEVEKALDSITLLVDTREQMTDRLKDRLELAGLPYERQKLDYGDYSAKCDVYDLSTEVVIERKMNLDELRRNDPFMEKEAPLWKKILWSIFVVVVIAAIVLGVLLLLGRIKWPF